MLLVGVDAGLHPVDNRLVHDELPVVADVDLEPVHRPRRWAFKVESADVVARAVAGALELLLGLEPSRRASEVRALGEDRVEASLGADDPGAKVLLVLLADLADHVVAGKAGLELRGGKEQHPRKRRADRRKQAECGEHPETAPAEPPQKIASAP